MLKALFTLLKLTAFSIAVLLAGQWIRWDGRNLAQHVQAQADRARRSDPLAYARSFARRLTDDARMGFDKRKDRRHDLGRMTTASAEPVQTDELRTTVAHSEERIPASERQKLRALIRELNSAKD